MLLIYLLVQAKLALLHVFVDSLRQIAVYAQKILFLKFCTSFWFSLRTCRSSFSCFALIFENIPARQWNDGCVAGTVCKSECCLLVSFLIEVMWWCHAFMFYLMCLMIVGEDSIWWWFDSSQDSIIPVQEDTTGTKLNKLPFLLNSNWTQLN